MRRVVAVDDFIERPAAERHYEPDEDDFTAVKDAADKFIDAVFKKLDEHFEEQSRKLNSPAHKDALIARCKELEAMAADPKTSGFDLTEALITSLRKQRAMRKG